MVESGSGLDLEEVFDPAKAPDRTVAPVEEVSARSGERAVEGSILFQPPWMRSHAGTNQVGGSNEVAGRGWRHDLVLWELAVEKETETTPFPS